MPIPDMLPKPALRFFCMMITVIIRKHNKKYRQPKIINSVLIAHLPTHKKILPQPKKIFNKRLINKSNMAIIIKKAKVE